MNTPDMRSYGVIVLTSTIAAVSMFGCSRPQVKPQNRVLIKALRTAVNTRQGEWLEKVAARVEASFRASEMGEEEHGEFVMIIDTARSGNWEQAEEKVLKLAFAQRPTEEEIRRLEQGENRPHQH